MATRKVCSMFPRPNAIHSRRSRSVSAGTFERNVRGFSRLFVVGYDQPVGPLGPFAVAEEMDLGGAHFPLLGVERPPREWHLSPRLRRPVRTEPREVIDALAGPALFRSRTARSLRQHAEALGDFRDERLFALVEALQKTGLAAVVLVAGEPVETESVAARSSRAIRHLDRYTTASGMSARRHRSRSSLPLSGRNRSESTGVWNRPRTRPRGSVTMPFSCWPSTPQYCRCTPGVSAPVFATEVASIRPIVPRASGSDIRGKAANRG